MGNETLACAIRGDDDALCTILRGLDCELRSHIGRNIGSQHRREIEVDDVLQVTYMEVFLHIRRFRHQGIEAFRSWLWQTAENNIRDALRVLNAVRRPPPGKRITPEDRDDSYVDLLIQMGGTHSTPSKFMARKEAKRVMNDAINRLPFDYATVVRLCDLDGYTSSQAAAAMHRSEAAVRMLRARAHDRLIEIVGSVLTP